MATKKNVTAANIIETKWRNCSISGNSSYWVTFRDIETDNIIYGYTAPDAACAYGVRNYGKNDIVYIKWHQTKSGKIIIDYIEKDKNNIGWLDISANGFQVGSIPTCGTN